MAKVIEQNESSPIRIKVVGVGNAGANILQRIREKVEGAEFIVFNTNTKTLKFSNADIKIQIGEKTTHGRGTGKDPEKGKFAANEDKERIGEALRGSNIIFLVAGLGGGTGTGGAPVIAKIAKDLGAIVIALVTTPFHYEGERRFELARAGIENLEKNVDTLVHIPNERLREAFPNPIPIREAFGKIDEIVARTVASISDLINKPQLLLDIDFADICSVVENAGRGIVGLGSGTGPDKMNNAARSTIDDPLIEKSDMMEARNILISITGSPSLTLEEIYNGMDFIQTRISSTSRVLGVSVDEKLVDEVKITLLATGIGGTRTLRITPPRPPSPPAKTDELSFNSTTEDDIDIPPSMRKQKPR